MLSILLNQTSIPLLEQVAAFSERRHEVLAGNIANIDTPGYRTRDLPILEFHEALQAEITRRAESVSSRENSVRSVSHPPMETPSTFDRFREVADGPPRNLTFQDGNNRSLEHELLEITKNSMMHRYALTVMNTQTRMLETAISERVV